MPARQVAVIGPADASAQEEEQAYAVGRLLAERGAVVVTGGLGGVMAAAARGCTDAGGVSLGLLPGEQRAGRSSVEVPTGLGELRNGLVVRAADALIAIGGSWGTLSEIALACREGRTVVCLGGWQVTDGAGRALPLERAQDAEAAVTRALSG